MLIGIASVAGIASDAIASPKGMAPRRSRRATVEARPEPISIELARHDCAIDAARPFLDHVSNVGREAASQLLVQHLADLAVAYQPVADSLMIRQGRVYENLMVDLRATNAKLRDRAARIVSMLTGLSREEAFTAIGAAGGSVKGAIVMRRLGMSRDLAERRLEAMEGRLDAALGNS